MVPERIKIKIAGEFEATVNAIAPEGFYDKLGPEKQLEWANKYVKEMRIDRLMEEMKLSRVDAIKVLDVLSIFDKPLVRYIQRGSEVEESTPGSSAPGGQSPS